jgi:hypothetical protein
MQSHPCARNGTVIAIVLPNDPPSSATWNDAIALASSAAAFNFPCIVVQPFAKEQSASTHLFVLPSPTPPLLPRSRWCNSSSAFFARRVELHRLRLWAQLADQGLSILGLHAKHRLSRDPLPALAALRTRKGLLPDIIGHTPGWFAKTFYLASPMFIRWTDPTRSLLHAAAARVHGSYEDIIFSEELNHGAGRDATCCHTTCLSTSLVSTAPTAHRASRRPSSGHSIIGVNSTLPALSMLDLDVRVEAPSPKHSRHWPNTVQCRAAGLDFDDQPPLAPPPPNSTANRWPRKADGNLESFGSLRYGTTAKGLPLMQLAWRSDAFNTLHVPLHRFGRCTGRTESCIGLHPSCPPPPPPFNVLLAQKKADMSRSKRKGKRSSKASKRA